MSKVISVTSLRNGVGRSAVSCLLSNALAELEYKVLIIDNNFKYCDVANYMMVKPDYTVDDLRPFLRSGVLEKDTILSMAISAGKGVDVLCGSQMNFSDNTLGYEDVKEVKALIEDVYDYIIIDGRSGIENDEVLSLASIVEKNIIVTRPNKHDSEHFERLKGSLDEDKASKLSAMIDKSVMVYNMLVEGAKYDTQYGSELVGSKNIFRISYDEKILDYLNGFNVGLSAHNKEAVEKLAEVIGEKTKEKKQSLLGIDVSKVKSLFGSV